MNKKGFTLIELLVVIAIVGILASVVLAAVGSSRARAVDTAIKSNLYNVRHQAEIYNTLNDGFGSSFPVGVCAATPGTLFSDPTIIRIITSAGDESSNSGISGGSCVSTPLAWAVSVPLKTNPAKSWCVDVTAVGKEVTPVGGDRGFNGVACK